MRRVRQVIDDGILFYERLLADRGVDIVRSAARFVSQHELEAGDLRITFRHALIATGARPNRLDVPGAEVVPTLTSDDLLAPAWNTLPGHLLCVGAGAVSLEFAQIYRRLGAEVTVIQRGEHLAHGEDEELGDLLKGYLEEEGVRVLTGSAVERLELVDGRPAVDCVGGNRVVGDAILAAVGRLPNVDGLGLEELGIDFDRSGIKTDDHLRTAAPNVWAVGDSHGEMLFTHVATYEAPLAIANMLDGAENVPDYRVMPRGSSPTRSRHGGAHRARRPRSRLRGRSPPLRRRHARESPCDR